MSTSTHNSFPRRGKEEFAEKQPLFHALLHSQITAVRSDRPPPHESIHPASSAEAPLRSGQRTKEAASFNGKDEHRLARTYGERRFEVDSMHVVVADFRAGVESTAGPKEFDNPTLVHNYQCYTERHQGRRVRRVLCLPAVSEGILSVHLTCRSSTSIFV